MPQKKKSSLAKAARIRMQRRKWLEQRMEKEQSSETGTDLRLEKPRENNFEEVKVKLEVSSDEVYDEVIIRKSLRNIQRNSPRKNVNAATSSNTNATSLVRSDVASSQEIIPARVSSSETGTDLRLEKPRGNNFEEVKVKLEVSSDVYDEVTEDNDYDMDDIEIKYEEIEDFIEDQSDNFENVIGKSLINSPRKNVNSGPSLNTNDNSQSRSDAESSQEIIPVKVPVKRHIGDTRNRKFRDCPSIEVSQGPRVNSWIDHEFIGYSTYENEDDKTVNIQGIEEDVVNCIFSNTINGDNVYLYSDDSEVVESD